MRNEIVKEIMKERDTEKGRVFKLMGWERERKVKLETTVR